MSEVLILPCNGIGSPLSTITRYAAYRAADKLRERGVNVRLFSIGRLLGQLPEALEQMRRASALVVIEGCPRCCATLYLDELGAEMAGYVYVPDVMRGCGVGRRRLDRKFLGVRGTDLVEAVAEATVVEVEKLVEVRQS